MRAEHPSAPLPADPAGEPVDSRPNRAARRGKHAGTVPAASDGRRAALPRILTNPPGGQPRDPGSSGPAHARGAQGRRIIPVRRTG